MRWYASLRRPGEIAFVRRRGRRVAGAGFAFYAAEQRGSRSRVAITVSKSVGSAVVRNLVKRRVKGALDALRPLEKPMRVVIVARPEAAGAAYEALAAEVARSIGQLSAG